MAGPKRQRFPRTAMEWGMREGGKHEAFSGNSEKPGVCGRDQMGLDELSRLRSYLTGCHESVSVSFITASPGPSKAPETWWTFNTYPLNK